MCEQIGLHQLATLSSLSLPLLWLKPYHPSTKGNTNGTSPQPFQNLILLTLPGRCTLPPSGSALLPLAHLKPCLFSCPGFSHKLFDKSTLYHHFFGIHFKAHQLDNYPITQLYITHITLLYIWKLKEPLVRLC